MPTLIEITEAMADQIRSVIVAVIDVDVQVEPLWVVNATPPTIDMYVSDPSADQELRAFGEAIGGDLITIRARVDMADSVAGQRLLWAFMDDEDPLSISAALSEDKTLGGLATSLDVRERSGMVRVMEGGDFLGCLWQVLVIKARS